MAFALPLALALMAATLSACGDDDPRPTSPAGDSGPPRAGSDSGDGTAADSLAGGAPPAAHEPSTLILVSGNLRAPLDLLFGPAGSGFDDELFVVHFIGVEAPWVRNYEGGSPALQRFERSLEGAVAVDMDPSRRFYFACMTPPMGASVGVVTVRRLDGSVEDFQYRGVDRPSGLALDETGDLYVFNRGDGTVVRLDFSDGAGPDQHGVQAVAEGLVVTEEVLPNHLLIGSDGRLFISETGADRVRVWDGRQLDVFAEAGSGLRQPVDIAQLPSGHILVANHGDGAVVELDDNGAAVRTLDTGLGAGRLQSVAVRSDGAVFVVDDEGVPGDSTGSTSRRRANRSWPVLRSYASARGRPPSRSPPRAARRQIGRSTPGLGIPP